MSANLPSVLIASISARGLVQAARRSGFKPFAVDFFADQDLQDDACGWRKMSGPIAEGFQRDELVGALQELAAGADSAIAGIVCGSGFEDRPGLLDALGEHWPLLGNCASVVRHVNDPEMFFGGLEELGLAYPRFQFVPPSDAAGWLFKKTGGAGGSHIVDAAQAVTVEGYFQELWVGQAFSVLLLGDGQGALSLGVSEQWVDEGLDGAKRYGGAVQPAFLDEDIQRRLESAATEIAEYFRLKGLNSVDFLVSGNDFVVLEVNPRAGATLDIYDIDDASLFALHVNAIHGVLPVEAPRYHGAYGACVVYAPGDVFFSHNFSWPSFARDCPVGGQKISAHAPMCTIFVAADDADVTKRSLHQHSLDILGSIGPITN